MRDDLHKSVPPRMAWARVLRLACAHANEAELREAIVRAVRSDAEWLGTPWGLQLERAFDLGRNDLFAEAKVRASLTQLLVISPNPQARAVCEIALGILARDGTVPADFKTMVFSQALPAFAEDCVELVSSKVAIRFGADQAGQVRRLLAGLLSGCDFLSESPPRESVEHATLDSVLNEPLPLRL